jgi:hypothetical protein
VKVFAAYANGTTWNMYNGVQTVHGMPMSSYPNNDYLVSFGVDSSGFWFTVTDLDRSATSGRKAVGANKPQLMGEKVFGNSVSGGTYGLPMPKIYTSETVVMDGDTVYFDGATMNQYTTTRHFLTSAKSSYALIANGTDTASATQRTFKIAPNYIILPHAPRKYFQDLGLEAIYNMRVKP